MKKIKKSGRFVLRIYKIRYCFDRYDDRIYKVPEHQIDPGTVRITRYADSKEELLDVWKSLLRMYEGYTYGIRDLLMDAMVVGGVFDPSDHEVIEDYFAG